MRFVAIFALAMTALASCNKEDDSAQRIQTVPVERRDIIVDAEATGVVEPINVIEVKSKASGQIERMPVETGSKVSPGDLLVQVDTRDVRNQYNQALADLRAAEARVAVAQAQRKRSEDLHRQQIITAQELETAQLDFANAQAQVTRADASLDLARQRLEDATVRAPLAGTIIEKAVSTGQVITSATGAFGGGTLLLKMADLSQVRVRALVNETDIGNIQSGQQATVIVDAYPDRPFRGSVEKIEPQAVIQQNVTMFPVLVAVSNREGLLMPGMNGEVSVLVEQRDNVLSVPNDAVRPPRDIDAAAAALGLNPEEVRKQVQAQFGGGLRGGANGADRMTTISRGDVVLNEEEGASQQGQMQQMPAPTAAQCAEVRAALDKKPELRARLDSLRAARMSGSADPQQMRERMRATYTELGVDARVAMGCARAQRSAADSAGGQRPSLRSEAPESAAPRNGGRRGLVFVAKGQTFEPRIVALGIANYDYTEVVSGLTEGEQVAVITAAALQQARQERLERFRGMTGGGVPGMQRQTPGGGGGGGGGGAPRGGGGR